MGKIVHAQIHSATDIWQGNGLSIMGVQIFARFHAQPVFAIGVHIGIDGGGIQLALYICQQGQHEIMGHGLRVGFVAAEQFKNSIPDLKGAFGVALSSYYRPGAFRDKMLFRQSAYPQIGNANAQAFEAQPLVALSSCSTPELYARMSPVETSYIFSPISACPLPPHTKIISNHASCWWMARG